MSAGAAGAAGAAAAVVRAIKASGVIVRVEPEDFQRLLRRQQEPLVVHATSGLGGFFGTYHQYLSSYKGLAFFTRSPDSLTLPSGCEVVQAKKIWMPG